MCFFSKPKAPAAPAITQAPPAAPAPKPIVMPSEVSPQTKEETRRKRLDKLRFGLASTIKTSPRGITGTGVNLSAPVTGKTTLGS